MPRKITAELLAELGACEDIVKLFRELFPDGVIPTVDLCVKHAATFDWVWAAGNLLQEPFRANYMAAERTRGAAHIETILALIPVHDGPILPFRVPYDSPLIPIIAAKLAAYNAAQARAFAEAFIAQSEEVEA